MTRSESPDWEVVKVKTRLVIVTQNAKTSVNILPMFSDSKAVCLARTLKVAAVHCKNHDQDQDYLFFSLRGKYGSV